ncbi:single-stranded-DNA-specific exonuclease RecJ [Kordiimonas sp. SCSIO 12610]|uniref:single-stranded-DNA-specific exonuclease RecJ n=1 Tax=Kordiimonas sp. SCSIO 12610 TaxID=2829597 RepID=UPI00210E5F5E|nr:single-stranded-DNA-specific exonuclease RecJ [Kordiimonas sp. SCSIO 12610]UTW54218.1 single-stranded-DNA-specific exonuclease RecJ [Kordiimonas sp. SCSIO 12610]
MADPVLGVRHSILGQAWQLRPYSERLARAIADNLNVSPIIGQLINARGIGIENAPSYFAPSLKEMMPDPSIILDMDKGVGRIIRAIHQGEKIAVFGDYDVDGATSSAIFVRFFEAIGIPVHIYIPDRMIEGYGPNANAMNSLRARGIDLVVTVDCGTLSFEPLKVAKNIGLDVIVVDHHKAEPELPVAVAVINPNRLDDESDLGQLAAVGVTFLFLVAINRALREAGFYGDKVREPNLVGFLDIVALGTICDVVPLTGLNRAYVTQGLKVMAARRNVGLTALADVGRISEAPNTYHAGFILGPRVNAGGRVGESGLGARLLTTHDPIEAREIADRLDTYNSERRAIEADVLKEALAQAEAKIGIDGQHDTLVFVAGEGWHAGVIGIVASRLKDKYGLPTFVLALEDGEGKGSGRSISGVDMGAAVIEAVQAGLLIKGGGHSMAAGLSVASDKLDELETFLRDYMAKSVQVASSSKSLKVDGIIAMTGATPALLDEIERVGPFGMGNPGPRFIIPEVTLVKADRVGENHLRCIFKSKDGSSMKVMAFRQADEDLGNIMRTGIGRQFHIAGKLKKDMWTGRPKVEMTLDDASLIGPG